MAREAARGHDRPRVHGPGARECLAPGRALLRRAVRAGAARVVRPQRGARARRRRSARLRRSLHRLAGGRGAHRRRSGRHLHARRLASADRAGRSRCGQGDPVREAARELAGRGRADAGCGAARGRDPHAVPQLPARTGGAARPAVRRRWQARPHPPLPRHVPAGLDRRSGLPAGVAPAEGARGLGSAGRHRVALDRPGALPGRRDRGGLGTARDVRARAAARRRRRSRPGYASTMQRSRWCASGTGRSAASRARASVPAARTTTASSSTAAAAASCSISSGSTSSRSTRSRGATAASAACSRPMRSIRSSRPGGRRVTCWAGSTRSSTRWPTCCRGSRRQQVPSPNFEDGVRTQRVLDAIERSARSRSWQAV